MNPLLAPLTLTETVKTEYGLLRIVLAKYTQSNLLAVQLECAEDDPVKENFEGEQFGTLSFNPVPWVGDPGLGCFYAKTWTENELIVPAMLASGLFERTEARLPGNTPGEIWGLKGSAWAEFEAAVKALSEPKNEARATKGPSNDNSGPEP